MRNLHIDFDMAKGFVPVYAYVHMTQMNLAESNGLALVLAAPVAGHIFLSGIILKVERELQSVLAVCSD